MEFLKGVFFFLLPLPSPSPAIRRVPSCYTIIEMGAFTLYILYQCYQRVSIHLHSLLWINFRIRDANVEKKNQPKNSPAITEFSTLKRRK